MEAGSSGLSAAQRFKRLVIPLAFAALLVVSNLGWYFYATSGGGQASDSEQALLDGEAPSNKVALLIGNSSYETPLSDSKYWPELPNPGNDVKLVRESLEQIGFDVITVIDADWDAMNDAIAQFSRIASDSDVALFYYAGHGFEFGRQNYLVPTNAPVTVRDTQLAYRYIDFERAANAITSQGTTIFMLDACRTEAPAVTITQVDGGTSHAGGTITDYDFPVGARVAVLYSTARGVPAKDGVPPDLQISPFAAEVARNITIPRVELTTLFSTIRKGVYDRTNGFPPPQAPYTYNSLDPNFFLTDGRTPLQRAASDRDDDVIQPLVIAPERLATTDETVLAVQVLAERPVSELETLAALDDPMATYLLGYMYEYGVGVDKDLDRARELLETAAQQGTASGQLELAHLLNQPDAKQADRTRALELYRAAAEQDFAKAQGHLASVYMTGSLVPNTRANYDRGVQLLRDAAGADYPYAHYALVLRGNAADRRNARNALDQLAASGNTDAHHWLCEIEMTAGSYRAARQPCTIAAIAGYADAQAQMALAAFNGWGRERSLVDARHWMRQALSDPTLEDGKRGQLLSIRPAVRDAI